MKIYNVESQIINTAMEATLFYECIQLAHQAGYTHVRDQWANGGCDDMPIHEALQKFKPAMPVNDNDELPF